MSRRFFVCSIFWLITVCTPLFRSGLPPARLASPSAPILTAAVSPIPSSEASCQGASQMRDVMIPSEALGQTIPVRLYLPPCTPTDGSGFPVIYLLHGASADETQWDDVQVDEAADNGRAQGTLPPVILVFPRRIDDTGSPRPDGDLPFEHFIAAELIPWLEKNTPARADRDHRAIGGISRGGFWALEIAFHHPELFSAVGGHSPVVGSQGNLLSPMGLLLAQPAALRALRVWLDGGSEDSLTQGAANLATNLAAADVPTKFEQWPGGHNRAYWRRHSADYLAFYTAAWINSQEN